MMHVGIVRVSMDQWRMNVRVRVRLVSIPGKVVGMPMVFIMHVGVRVFQLLVCMQMPMMFSEVQPDACGHQQSRGDELDRNGITLQQDR